MRLLTAHRPTKEKRTPNKNMKHKVCLKFYDKACKRFVIKIEDFDSEAFDHACAKHKIVTQRVTILCFAQ